jgi:hypothetical protein
MGTELFKNTVAAQWPSEYSHQFFVSEGTFTDNSPVSGSVAWSGVVVQYGQRVFQVADGYTDASLPWVYWVGDTTPATFSTSATCPTTTDETIIVGYNSSGTWTDGWKAGQTIQADMVIGNLSAGRISVTELSGLSANLGTITAGTVSGVYLNGVVITGSTVRTAASGGRIEIDSTNGIRGISGSGTTTWQGGVDGSLTATNITVTGGSIGGTTITGCNIIASVYIQSASVISDFIQSTGSVTGYGFIAGGGGYTVGTNYVVRQRQAAVTAPTGGGTTDAEARTAINDIINRLQAHGLIY